MPQVSRIVSSAGGIVIALQVAAASACNQARSSRDALLHPTPTHALAGSSAPARAGGAPVQIATPPAAPPPVACPPEDLCGSPAILQADLPAAIDVARHWTFQACRNAECWSTRDNPDEKVLSGGDIVWIYLAVDSPGRTTVPMLMLSKVGESAPFLEVGWYNDRGVQDGDRFVIHAQEPGGKRHDLIDERVTYHWEVKPIGDCYYSCRRAHVDRRAPVDADAGM